ncbi:MAG TPA: Holliday junction resolvase RuvX [Burkholderiaceae bacterium]|nr:Holliday junction resolvase RuvX [Burkholderiaceae bacterium]
MPDGGAAPAPPETLLAFDFGVRRIGVALGNSLTGTARALETIDAVPTDRRFERIAALIRAWRPQRLVVGRPLDEDGAETETTRRSDRFSNQLAGRFGLPVARVDERFSSREAQAIIAAGGGRPEDEDGVAAAVILSQYLDGLRRASPPEPRHP